MRALLLLLVATAATGQPIGDRWHDRIRPQPVGAPLFTFAPLGGAGMGTVCACTTPTGAKGETLTFTRASSGSCLKGNTTSSIANGDLVTCTANQPRVMPGGGGTGSLGLLAEESRSNVRIRSEEFDNVAWTAQSVGAVVPTVTADQAVAPDGTTTADRIQIPATTAGQYSFLFQTVTTTGTWSCGFFVKGNASSGDIGIAAFDNGAGVYRCARCNFVAGSWSRCLKENVATGDVNATFWIGNGTHASICNDGAHAAVDAFIWGAQCEVGAYLSSYLKTTTVAVTRAADVDNLPLALSNTTGSIAATVVTDHTALASATDYGIVTLSTAGPTFKYILDFDNTGPNMLGYFNAATTTLTESLVASTPLRWVAWWDASSRNLIRNNGGTATGAVPTPVATTLVEIGQYGGVHQPGFVIKQVCVDPSPSRCR